MKQNDYIAKYVKENHPEILGIDFSIWKIIQLVNSVADELIDVLGRIDTFETIEEYYQKMAEDAAAGQNNEEDKEDDKT